MLWYIPITIVDAFFCQDIYILVYIEYILFVYPYIYMYYIRWSQWTRLNWEPERQTEGSKAVRDWNHWTLCVRVSVTLYKYFKQTTNKRHTHRCALLKSFCIKQDLNKWKCCVGISHHTHTFYTLLLICFKKHNRLFILKL